jgi:hypothetical protein
VIPEFDDNGNLPPGVHEATVKDVEQRFAYNTKRKVLFARLFEVCEILGGANCPRLYLDGSFITKKEEPNDYDLCYEWEGMVHTSEFEQFLRNRKTAKERYLGDIFIRMPQPPYYFDHVEDWQTDSRQDDVVKGIIQISLRSKDSAQE